LGHDHSGKSHAGHSHAAPSTDANRLAIAFGIIAVFMVVEIVGGILSGSLALLADAGHMTSDTVALGMSWLAIRMGRRPADAGRSFGYRRLEVLAAFVNGCALFVIAGWVVYEAVRRFWEPVAVLGGTMLGVAIAGAIANLVAFWILNGGNKANLNVRSAWVHVLGDLFGSVAAIAAAGLILWTGWMPFDPILSIVVALIILKSAKDIVRDSANILLEGAPPGLDRDEMTTALNAALPQGCTVSHLHAWALTAEQPLVTMNVSCRVGEEPARIIATLQARLREKYGISHSTIQVDTGDFGVAPGACAAIGRQDHAPH
jgi:cobalt-zinc-cadmium efflux system protein